MTSGQMGFESRRAALEHYQRWERAGFAVEMWRLNRTWYVGWREQ